MDPYRTDLQLVVPELLRSLTPREKHCRLPRAVKVQKQSSVAMSYLHLPDQRSGLVMAVPHLRIPVLPLEMHPLSQMLRATQNWQ